MTKDLTNEFMLPPPDKQEIEIEVAGLFHNGDIGTVARYVQRDKGIVSKQLSAHCEDKNNVIYYFLLFLWAFDCIRRDLGDAVLGIIVRERDKWLAECPRIARSSAKLTADIGRQFTEFLEAELDGKDYDRQIKECVDIATAVNAKKADLIQKRNAKHFGEDPRLFAKAASNGRAGSQYK